MLERCKKAPLLAVLVVALLDGIPASVQGRAPRLKDSMTAAEFQRCGLYKLTAPELAALEEWFANRSASSRAAPPSPTAQRIDGGGPEGVSRSTELVAYNTSTGKYHCLSCQWALKCTRNCVNIALSEARARGVPCKVCGGSCR